MFVLLSLNWRRAALSADAGILVALDKLNVRNYQVCCVAQ